MEDYIKSNCTRCLYCKSDQIEGGFVEIENGKAFQHVHCLDCHKEWFDVYVFITVMRIENKEE